MEYIKESVPVAQLVVNRDAAIKTVYSAMHGVGYKYVVEAFETVNLKVSNWQSSVFSLVVSGLKYFSVSSVDVAWGDYENRLSYVLGDRLATYHHRTSFILFYPIII